MNLLVLVGMLNWGMLIGMLTLLLGLLLLVLIAMDLYMYLDPEHLVLHLYHEQDIPIYVNTDLVLVMVMPLNQLHNRLDQQGQLDLLLVDLD